MCLPNLFYDVLQINHYNFITPEYKPLCLKRKCKMNMLSNVQNRLKSLSINKMYSCKSF